MRGGMMRSQQGGDSGQLQAQLTAAQAAYAALVESGVATAEQLADALAAISAANTSLATASAAVAAWQSAYSRKFYVDAVDGNDANDGLSPGKAKQTSAGIVALVGIAGDAFLFKAGQVHAAGARPTANNQYFGRYGTGADPILSQQKDLATATWADNSGTVPGTWTATVAMSVRAGRCMYGINDGPRSRAAAAAMVGKDVLGVTGDWTQVGAGNVWSRALSGLTSPTLFWQVSFDNAAPKNLEEFQSHVEDNQSAYYKPTNATSGTLYVYATGNPASVYTHLLVSGGFYCTSVSGGNSTFTIFAPHGNPSSVYSDGILVPNGSGTGIAISTYTGTVVEHLQLAYNNQGFDVSGGCDALIKDCPVYGNNSAGWQVHGTGPGVIIKGGYASFNGVRGSQGNYGGKVGGGSSSDEVIDRTIICGNSATDRYVFDENGEDGFASQTGIGTEIYLKWVTAKRNNENAVDYKNYGVHYHEDCFFSCRYAAGGAGTGGPTLQGDCELRSVDSTYIHVQGTAFGLKTNPRTRGRCTRDKFFAARGDAVAVGNDVGTAGDADGQTELEACIMVMSDADASGVIQHALGLYAGNVIANHCSMYCRGTASTSHAFQLKPLATQSIGMSALIQNSIIAGEDSSSASTSPFTRIGAITTPGQKLRGVNNLYWFPGATNWAMLDSSNTPLTEALLDAGVQYALAFDGQTANFTAAKTLTGGTSGATAVIVAQVDSGTTGILYLKSWNGVPFLDNETITDNNGSPGSATANGLLQDIVQLTNSLTDNTCDPLWTNPWKGGPRAEDDEIGDFTFDGDLAVCPVGAYTGTFTQGEPAKIIRGGATVGTAWIAGAFAAQIVLSGLAGALASGDTIKGKLSLVSATLSGAPHTGWKRRALTYTGTGGFATGLYVTGGTSGATGLITRIQSGSKILSIVMDPAGTAFGAAETITDTGSGTGTTSGTQRTSPAKRAVVALKPPIKNGIDKARLDFVRWQASTSNKLGISGDGATLTLTDSGNQFLTGTDNLGGLKVGDYFQVFDAHATYNNVTLGPILTAAAGTITVASALTQAVTNDTDAFIFKTAPVTIGALAAA